MSLNFIWVKPGYVELGAREWHRQIEGIDFTETFSPTVSWNSVRLFLAFTVTNNLIPLQLDIDMAYLYGDIEPGVVIFIRPPQGIKLSGSYAYRLKKSIVCMD